MDLRERVVAAVLEDGMSCHASVRRFGVAASSAIKWVSACPRDRQRSSRPDGRS